MADPEGAMALGPHPGALEDKRALDLLWPLMTKGPLVGAQGAIPRGSVTEQNRVTINAFNWRQGYGDGGKWAPVSRGARLGPLAPPPY